MPPTLADIGYALAFALILGGIVLFVLVYVDRRHHADDVDRPWSDFTRWGRKRFPG